MKPLDPREYFTPLSTLKPCRPLKKPCRPLKEPCIPIIKPCRPIDAFNEDKLYLFGDIDEYFDDLDIDALSELLDDFEIEQDMSISRTTKSGSYEIMTIESYLRKYWNIDGTRKTQAEVDKFFLESTFDISEYPELASTGKSIKDYGLDLIEVKKQIMEYYNAAKYIWTHKIPKPPKNTDNHANWALMTWDWFFEQGSNPIYFDKDSAHSKDIAESYSIKEVKKKYYKTKKTPTGWRFTGSATATGTLGEVEWFLGSYEIKDFKLKDNKANFTIKNKSGWYSGTRLPQSWQNTIKSKTGFNIDALVTNGKRRETVKNKLIKHFGRYLFDIPGISILNNLPSFGGDWKQEYKIEMDWNYDEDDKK